MKGIWQHRRLVFYFLKEIVPNFTLGLVVFIFILLLFQALRLTEFVLIHGVQMKVILEIVFYLSISFIPAILPMSLLFSILLAHNRLSGDSEIIALKSSGVNLFMISLPSVLFATFIAITSFVTLFYVGPWGNRRFELLMAQLGNQKAVSQIREGTFSEGFFDLVIYANNIDSKTGQLKKVFIYDERNESLPLTIVAKKGNVINTKKGPNASATLQLKDGSIYRTHGNTDTKIEFESYDINLNLQASTATREKSPQSMTYTDFQKKLNSKSTPKHQKLKLQSEFHKRWAISFACIIFGLIGVGFGIIKNKRSGKSGGYVIAITILVLYWCLYLAMESLARNETLPAFIALWIPNIVFAFISYFPLKKLYY